MSDLIADQNVLADQVLLVGTSTLLATVIGVYLGIISGWNRGKKFDKTDQLRDDALLDAGVVARDAGFPALATGIGRFPRMFPPGG